MYEPDDLSLLHEYTTEIIETLVLNLVELYGDMHNIVIQRKVDMFYNMLILKSISSVNESYAIEWDKDECMLFVHDSLHDLYDEIAKSIIEK